MVHPPGCAYPRPESRWISAFRMMRPPREVLFVRHDFPITRWMFLTTALAGLVWFATSHPARKTAQDEPLTGDAHAIATTRAASGKTAMGSTAWPADLLTRDNTPVWQKYRSRLRELSRIYRTDPDSARSCALRDSMEEILLRSIRALHEHRLLRARSTGQIDMIQYLEHALANLPEESLATNQPTFESLTDDQDQAPRTTQQPQGRIEP
jgi:hypothetical protein